MIPVEYASRNQNDVMSGQRPANGIVLDVDPLDPGIIDCLPMPVLENETIAPIWVALDQIIDPQVTLYHLFSVICCIAYCYLPKEPRRNFEKLFIFWRKWSGNLWS